MGLVSDAHRITVPVRARTAQKMQGEQPEREPAGVHNT
jgi:hypothetical protein